MGLSFLLRTLLSRVSFHLLIPSNLSRIETHTFEENKCKDTLQPCGTVD